MKQGAKDWVQYSSACFMLLAGVVLTFISFFMNGDVTEHTLYFVAQCILYAGAVFGISIYVKSTVDKALNNLRDKLLKKEEEA